MPSDEAPAIAPAKTVVAHMIHRVLDHECTPKSCPSIPDFEDFEKADWVLDALRAAGYMLIDSTPATAEELREMVLRGRDG
jgi:hypothetical protein